MFYDISKHLILLYLISFLSGISCISFLVIVCKKESSAFYIQIRNFSIAFFIYVLYSFADYYKTFFFLKWEMNVLFMCLSNIVTVFFVYHWYRMNDRIIGYWHINKWFRVLKIEGAVFLIAWFLVYILFMDKEYNLRSLAGKLIAVIPDSIFYLSVFAINLYFIVRLIRNPADKKKRSYLLIINIMVLFLNCWGYLNDIGLALYPFGSQIINVYPFNPVVTIYLFINIGTFIYLYRINAFSWGLNEQSTGVNAELTKGRPESFEEIAERFHLTRRECEIIQLVYQGRSNPEISEILNISTGTVKRHVQNIFHKMDVKNRYELIYLVKSE